MPSPLSVIVREEIRLLKPFIGRMSIERARTFQDAMGEMGAKSVAEKVAYEPVAFEYFEACFALPCEEKDCSRVILYLHGGGYVAGNLQYARGFAGILADHTGRRILAVAYRLAPENPFPAALEDAVSAYRYLLDSGYEPEHIAFAGESAGGGLIFCLGQKLKELELPLPAAMVALSPWTDLTFSGASYKTNAKKDPSLNEAALRSQARAYAPEQADNPLVSPAFGDFAGFPPSLLLAGGNELLLSDAEMLAVRLVKGGCRCELVIEEGLWHVYVLFGIPEARAAMDRIAAFLELWA